MRSYDATRVSGEIAPPTIKPQVPVQVQAVVDTAAANRTVIPQRVAMMRKATVLLQCALLSGCIVLSGAAPAAAAAAPSVMALRQTNENVSRALQLISSSNPELDAYLSNPNTVCTFFAPTNKAMTDSMRNLGKYVGLASQNATLQNITFNYHVIPGKALTAADLMEINQTQTRADEPLWILHRRGEPLIYSRPDYPVALEQTDIKAGNCIVHTVNLALVPPSATPQIQKWLVELDTLPPPPPRADWGEFITPLHADLAAESEKRLAGNDTTSSASIGSSVVSGEDAGVPGAAGVAAARSSAGATGASVSIAIAWAALLLMV